LTPGGTGNVAFCCVPCIQEDTGDNKMEAAQFMRHKMVSK
jgi:hypothetical protein